MSGPNSADRAIDVTEAAMLAAIKAVQSGPEIKPWQLEAIWLGLTRAAARWATMTTPIEMDEGLRLAFAKCLEQERTAHARGETAGSA